MTSHNGCFLGVVFMGIDNLLMGKIAVTWLVNQQEKMNRKRKKIILQQEKLNGMKK